jgi:hypothetical protein
MGKTERKPFWVDTTHRHGGEPHDTPAREWTLTIGDGLIILVHHYIGCGDTWFATCSALLIKRRELKSPIALVARNEALALVRDKINAWHAAMPRRVC